MQRRCDIVVMGLGFGGAAACRPAQSGCSVVCWNEAPDTRPLASQHELL